MTRTAHTLLFRQQALEHATVRRYGTVVLAQPLSFTLLTAFFMAIAMCIVSFLAFFSITRKAQVNGMVLPSSGMIQLVPSQAGVIAQTYVHEGQRVRAGEVLFVLNSDRVSATQGAAGQTIVGLLASRRSSLQSELVQQHQQSTQRIEAARRRIQDLADEIRRVDDQYALQLRRVALAEESVTRYTELRAANFISPAQLQDRSAELLDQRQRLGDLARAKASASRELAAAQAELRDFSVQAERDREAAQRNISLVDQDLAETEARRETVLRAPQDGIVTGITARVGQAVNSGQVLATVLPLNTPLEVELYAPSRAAGFVKPGMTVMLRYQAYAYQKFGQQRGEVHEVSSTAMRSDEIPLVGTALSGVSPSEPLYRIRVRLERQGVLAYGVEQPLKPGMAVDASVLLERRRLYEWIVEPLHSITGKG